MTKKQAGRLDMYALIILFFAKFDTVLKTYAPIAAKTLALIAKEIEIKDLVNQQGYKSKGKTLTKEALRESTIELVLALAQIACGWAMETKNKTLQAIFDVEDTDFSIAQDEFVVMVDNILKALTDNLTELLPYEVTALAITAAKNMELDYVAAKEQPKQQTTAKKTVTTTLTKEFKAADGILLVCDKLMPGRFKKTDTAMVTEYFNNRKIYVSGTRHTTLKVHTFLDDAHTIPVSNVHFELVGMNRAEITDEHGDGEIVQFKGGSYILRVKAVGVVDQDVPFTIKGGKVLDLDIVLAPNIITGNVLSFLGTPAQGYNVSVVGTNISIMTDGFGNYELLQVPEGSGFIEVSNEGGDSMRLPYFYTQGQHLAIDFNFKKA